VADETQQLPGRIRPTTRGDIAEVVTLVHELAAYEHAADRCTLTGRQLETALFRPGPALFGHVAEIEGRIVGFTLWFLNFSTWDGVHGIHLEDLYVRPEHRQAGLGRALLDELAVECTRNGYTRLEWSVLDWNIPAIAFSRSLEGQPMDGWTGCRLSGRALRAIAGSVASRRGEHR